ncbi:hypothetical protein HK100_009422 [Physocladia obscura]|uniref:Uncharacterized protein n=1 Tax=Physocladia obscura TaxID=109957 RepID=A0AAD5XI02_9FUNG|nr:hypothetical protein HK100_009422 [Physocladia obscura]
MGQLSPASFSALVIIVESCIERRTANWSVDGARTAALRLLLSACSSKLFPPTHEFVLMLAAINVMAHTVPVSSLKTILTFQLERITLISDLDAVFDIAETIVGGSEDSVAAPTDSGINFDGVLILKRTSELGIFVRKLVLEYRSLNFQELAEFFESVLFFRDSILKTQQFNATPAATVPPHSQSSPLSSNLDFHALYTVSGVDLPDSMINEITKFHEKLTE